MMERCQVDVCQHMMRSLLCCHAVQDMFQPHLGEAATSCLSAHMMIGLQRDTGVHCVRIARADGQHKYMQYQKVCL